MIFSTEPDGASLVDPEQVDAWVANWGGWLAGLGDEAGLDAAAVTVETAPDSGYRLRNEVTMNIDPNAPEFAKNVLHEVVNTYPEGSATVRAWVSLSFNASLRAGSKKRTPEDVARDLASRIPGPVGPAAVHRRRDRPADVRAGTLRGRPDRLRSARRPDHRRSARRRLPGLPDLGRSRTLRDAGELG